MAFGIHQSIYQIKKSITEVYSYWLEKNHSVSDREQLGEFGAWLLNSLNGNERNWCELYFRFSHNTLDGG